MRAVLAVALAGAAVALVAQKGWNPLRRGRNLHYAVAMLALAIVVK